MKKKIVFIQLIQIICAWGVMNGHFMMHSCNDICDYLRNSNLKYSVLAFFFLGDLNVEVFFVLGGFLIRYADVNDVLHTILKKYVSVLMPGVCLTLAIAIVALINGDFVNSINDISILLTGNSYLDADQYIPHYLYQLWFCFPFIRAWTVAYLVSIICKDRNALFNVICIFILGSIDDSMTSVLLGMFFGRFTNILEKNKISSLGALIIGGLSIMLVPVLYAQKSILTNIVMYGLLGIAFQGMTLGNKYLRESKLINLISVC